MTNVGGGSGDDPATLHACDQREAAFAAVERNQGRCWNPRSANEVDAWPACTPDSKGKKLSPAQRAAWEDQAFYAWQDTQRCAYDTTMAFARQGTYGTPALKAAQGMCSSGKLPVILTILEGEDKAKEATALAVEQGYRRAANRLGR